MLLLPDEPAPFLVTRPAGGSPYFLLCDHASARMPARLGTLGLGPDELSSHITYDLGIRELAQELAEALDAPLVESGYSRLAIDCNRPLNTAGSIPEVSCQIAIPGNQALSPSARELRQELFLPYHDAIERALADRGQRPTAIVSMHSFTPELYGQARPWHIGIMYGKDRSLASLMLDALRGSGRPIGDNEPYQVTDGSDYGVPVYAERAGRPGVLIEVRQDLLASAVSRSEIASLLAAALLGCQSELFSPPKAE